MLASIATSSVAAEPTVRAGDRVLLMGDSEAFLLGQDMPEVLSADPVTFAYVALPGSSVISWSMGLEPQWGRVFAFHPTVVLVSLGANDACTGPSVVRNEGPYLTSFLRKLRRTGAREIVWLGPPRIGYPTLDRRQCAAVRAVPGLELFAELVKASGTRYLDARTIEVDLWRTDYLHCSRPQWPGEDAHGCLDWARWAWATLVSPDGG